MIPVSSKQDLFIHGINVDKSILEFSDLPVDPNATINAGSPVTIDPTSNKIVAVTSDVKCFGLSKSNKNAYVDETYGSFGAYGSGRLTVVVKGIVTVRFNYFIDSSGALVTVKTFDDSKTYVPMQELYVDSSGLITNVNTLSNTKLGYVLVPPTSTSKVMQFVLDC